MTDHSGNGSQRLAIIKNLCSQIPFSFFGFGFLYIWFMVIFRHPWSTVSSELGFAPLLFDGGICAAYLAVIALARKRSFGKTTRQLSIIGSSITVGCVIVYACFYFLGFHYAPTVAVVVFVCGAGFSLVVLTGRALWCAFGSAQVILLYCTTKIAYNLVLVLLEGFIDSYYIVVSAIILALACLSLLLANKQYVSKGLRIDGTQNSFPNAWKLFLLCSVYGVAYGYGYAACTGVVDYLSIRFVDIAACLAIVFLLTSWKNFDLIRLYQIALPAMAIGCLAIPALPFLPASASQVFLRISYTAILAYTLLVICNLCRHSRINPLALFCAYGIANHVSLDVGRYLYSFVSHGGDGLGGIELPSILVCGAAIATFLMLSENSLASSWGMQQTMTIEDLPARTIAKTLGQYKSEYRLTAREVEILDCLIRGMSANEIADEFFLSAGTVKAHTQHIYRKANVHSKEDLVALFLQKAAEVL